MSKNGYKVAPEDALWYNRRVNKVVSGGARNTPDRIYSLEEYIMDTLPPHAQDSKPTILCPLVNSSHQHYVYTLAYPESMGGYVFYVGKGKGNRIDHHEREARRSKLTEQHNKHKLNAIRKIWTNGKKVVKTKLAFFATHMEALRYEQAFIFLMRPYGHLVNLTDGGEGAAGIKRSEETLRKLRGRVVTEETRRKISKANKGKTGGIHSEEHRRKIIGAFKGRAHSEESRCKISESKKGHVTSEEHKRKISEFQKGRAHPEEHRRNQSEALKGHVLSEETRRKISESRKGQLPPNKGKPMSEEQKRKLSEAHKGKPLSEETRRKMSEARKRHVISEETRHKINEANRGQKRSPEVRAKISEAAKQRATRKREQALLKLRTPAVLTTDASWKQGLVAHSLWGEQYA